MSNDSIAFIRWEAQRHAAAGDHAGALELIGLINAPDAAIELLRGRILAQGAQFAPAADAFRAALAIDPANAEARQGLALADRLAGSWTGWFRLHARRWFAALVIVALLAFGFTLWFQQPGGRELARSITVLDGKVAASMAVQQAGNRELAERLTSLEQSLQRQAEASGQSNEQFRNELRRLQTRLAATATDEKMRTVQREMIDMLKRLESTAGSTQKH